MYKTYKTSDNLSYENFPIGCHQGDNPCDT